MEMLELPEVWLRGPVAGVIPYLQPAAHALLQAQEEVNKAMEGFPVEFLWYRPSGMAPVAFHLQHMAGVQDRLLTYAKGNALTREQLEYLSQEGKYSEFSPKLPEIMDHFNEQIQISRAYLDAVKECELTEQRLVGRKKLPSTVIGLIFHAAEHTQRHAGQLLVTAGFCREEALKRTKTSI